ncbi:MAG: hypothetical protein R3A47_02315 [Polyangiales bacterium]
MGQAVVIGDRRPFLSALITLDPENIAALCEKVGLPTAPANALSRESAILAYLQERVESECNARVARYQTIKKIAILPDEFTVEGGELTATMKLRRNEINQKYKSIVDGFYAGGTERPESTATV